MYYDLAQTSLVKTPISLAEMYIPLWVYSISAVASTATASGGSSFIQKGSTSLAASSASATRLHTLNSSWQSTQKYAFEASIFVANAVATGYAALWDITSGTIITGSQISVGNNSYFLLRSGQFTLTSGHVYGITCWTSNSSYNASLTKAHLVAFLS